MDFIKKNYEKIILCVVLLGLVGLLILMWLVIMADKQQQEDIRKGIIHGKVQELPALDLTRQSAVIDRLKSPQQLDWTATNKLFNPVRWVRDKDGKVIKEDNPNKIGPHAAIVTKVTPLYFILTIDEVTTNQLTGWLRYKIGVERQAAPQLAQRRKVSRYVSGDDAKKDLFTLITNKVAGAEDNPNVIHFKLADSGEIVPVSADQPFRRVDGYTADIKYDPEKLNVFGQRVGDHLKFASDDFTIIGITQNEVTLLAQSNQKKYPLPFAP
jgi:hypothetical protein